MKRHLYVGTNSSGTLAILAVANLVVEKKVGQAIGVSVEAQDHVWIIHRAGLAGSRRIACNQAFLRNCTPCE